MSHEALEIRCEHSDDKTDTTGPFIQTAIWPEYQRNAISDGEMLPSWSVLLDELIAWCAKHKLTIVLGDAKAGAVAIFDERLWIEEDERGGSKFAR